MPAFPARRRAPLNACHDPAPDEAISFLDDSWEGQAAPCAIKGKGDIKARHFKADDQAGQRAFVTSCSSATYNIYFVVNSVKNTLHKKPEKTDIAEAHSLFVDLDPRKDKSGVVIAPLEAERATMLALLTINRPAGIPKPNRIVDSGRGYWAFWFLDTPHPVDATKAVEAYGRGIEQAFGDFADNCHNIDRVARLPGAINQRTGEMARVLHEHSHDTPYAIETFPRAPVASRQSTSQLKLVWDSVALPPRTPHPRLFTAEYQAEIGKVYDDTPLDPRITCKLCPFFRDAFKTGGKDHPQGLWMQAGLACTFMENGRHVFHKLSEKHPGYTSEETDEMFDRKVAEREEKSWLAIMPGVRRLWIGAMRHMPAQRAGPIATNLTSACRGA